MAGNVCQTLSDGETEDDEEGGEHLRLGARGALGWESYAHFEEEVMEALESDAPVLAEPV